VDTNANTNDLIHARLSPDVKRLLEERAARHGVPLAVLVREAVHDYLGVDVTEDGRALVADRRSRSWFPEARERVES
jgi:hypothetical protein